MIYNLGIWRQPCEWADPWSRDPIFIYTDVWGGRCLDLTLKTVAAVAMLLGILFMREISSKTCLSFFFLLFSGISIFDMCNWFYLIYLSILRGGLSFFEHEAASEHALRASSGQVYFLRKLPWRSWNDCRFFRINLSSQRHKNRVRMYANTVWNILWVFSNFKILLNIKIATNTTLFSERGVKVVLSNHANCHAEIYIEIQYLRVNVLLFLSVA